jgi:hypothetical protein
MEHSADEAGGEAIFTSDGLPSLSAPLPPPSSNSSNAVGIGTSSATATDNDDDDIANNNDAIISVEAVDQRKAFDTFQDAGTGWMGLSHPTKNNVTSVGPSSGSTSGVGWEDPRRKLFQLKSEIDLLEKSLLEQQKRQAEVDDNENRENEELRVATLELKSKLTSLGLVSDVSLSNMLRGRQVDLSMLITKDIEKFNTTTDHGDGNLNLSKDLENLSIKKGEEGMKEGDATTKMGNKIVYELYRDTTTTTVKSTTSSSSSSREIMLEERLRKLELALGSSSSTPSGVDGSDKSILERIEEAEKLTQQVDSKSMDKLAAKAKVIRADLEAAARAKTKLSSKSSSSSNAATTASGQQQKEDAQMISRLHTQLLELEGISSHLPQLTLRLVELSNLHTSASNFASRLNAVETAVTRCESMLVNVEGTLNTMEEGWKSNMDVIESNVRRLDELLANKT